MIKSKVIWFVNKDSAPIEEYGTHLRTFKQAQYFQSKGFDVKILCSSLVHNTNINHLEGIKNFYKEEIHNDIHFVFVRSLKYKKNGIKRILAYAFFSFNIFRLKNKIKKPNTIIHTSRIPFDLLVFFLSKRIKVKYILDITDLWPLEFEHFGYLSSKNFILKTFYWIEKKLYASANFSVFSMEGCYDYIKEKKWDKDSGGIIDLKNVHYINNGIDLIEFENNLRDFSIKDEDLNNDDLFKIIYIGSIRLANNVSQIIDVAKRLRDYKDIKFLIYGDGSEREILENRCIDENINNVVFKQKWIGPKYVPYALSKASVNILNYGSGWGKYGGSMNKMFMSFASGKPIVCNAGLNYSLINKNNLGIDKEFESTEDYSNAILSIYNLDEKDYKLMCERLKKTSLDFDSYHLAEKFSKFCEIE